MDQNIDPLATLGQQVTTIKEIENRSGLTFFSADYESRDPEETEDADWVIQ